MHAQCSTREPKLPVTGVSNAIYITMQHHARCTAILQWCKATHNHSPRISQGTLPQSRRPPAAGPALSYRGPAPTRTPAGWWPAGWRATAGSPLALPAGPGQQQPRCRRGPPPACADANANNGIIIMTAYEDSMGNGQQLAPPCNNVAGRWAAAVGSSSWHTWRLTSARHSRNSALETPVPRNEQDSFSHTAEQRLRNLPQPGATQCTGHSTPEPGPRAGSAAEGKQSYNQHQNAPRCRKALPLGSGCWCCAQ